MHLQMHIAQIEIWVSAQSKPVLRIRIFLCGLRIIILNVILLMIFVSQVCITDWQFDTLGLNRINNLCDREDEHVPVQRPSGGRRHEEEHDWELQEGSFIGLNFHIELD